MFLPKRKHRNQCNFILILYIVCVNNIIHIYSVLFLHTASSGIFSNMSRISSVMQDCSFCSVSASIISFHSSSRKFRHNNRPQHGQIRRFRLTILPQDQQALLPGRASLLHLKSSFFISFTSLSYHINLHLPKYPENAPAAFGFLPHIPTECSPLFSTRSPSI